MTAKVIAPIRCTAMNARPVKFSLASLCMHIAVAWLLVQQPAYEHGVAQGARAADTALTVSLLAPELSPAPLIDTALFGGQPASAEAPLAPDPSPLIRDVGLPDAQEPLAAQDYLEVGRLTKLPSPLSEVDLNVSEITELAPPGQTRLTVLVNEAGAVVDVFGLPGSSGLGPFVERVAARFRSARFSPGEVDGVAVKSQVQITVVSEALSATTGE